MSDRLNYELAHDDTCPRCLGELDTGWECNDCGYDAMPHIKDVRFLPELTAQELATIDSMPPIDECLPHWKAGEIWNGDGWVKK